MHFIGKKQCSISFRPLLLELDVKMLLYIFFDLPRADEALLNDERITGSDCVRFSTLGRNGDLSFNQMNVLPGTIRGVCTESFESDQWIEMDRERYW